MSRLPVPGSDANAWGDLLNDYLTVAHTADGNLKPVDGAKLLTTSVSKAKLSSQVQDSLTKADTQAAKYFNISDYGAKSDGVTDDSNAVNAASAAALAAGGGIVYFPAGVTRAAGIVVRSKICYAGSGAGATVVRLPDGSTKDVFIGQDYASLAGTTSGGGTLQWTIRDMSIDGNKAAAPSGGCGIKVFGCSFTIIDVDVYACKADGLYLEYGDTTGGVTYTTSMMESYVEHVKVFDCDANGFNIKGVHDSMATNCTSARNKLANFRAGGDSWNWVSCHAWGYSEYAWLLQGHNQLVNCQGEGATIANYYIQWHDTQIIGGKCFFPDAPGAIGIKIGDAVNKPQRVTITGMYVYDFTSANGASIDVSNAGSQLYLTANVDQASGTAVAGTPPEDAYINVLVGGGLQGASVFKVPGIALPRRDTVALPAAFYDSFTATDGSAVDSSKWVTSVGGGSGASMTVQGNRLRLRCGASGGYDQADRVTTATALAPSLKDAELLFKFTHGTLSVESYFYAALRASSSFVFGNSGYAVLIGHNTDGSAYWQLVKYVSDAGTMLYNGGGYIPTAGQSKWFRLRVKGSALSVRCWDDGQPEPFSDTFATTDSAVSAGGLVSFSMGGGGAAAGSEQFVDNVTVYAL